MQFPLLLCTKESAVARFSKRIASAGHFLSPKSPAFCNNGRCRHVLSCGPRFDRVCFCLGEKICALLADVCRPFSQVGDIKTLLSNLQSVRALSEEPLREASPKNQDIPETESNQSLVSAKLLMCSFRSCSAQENPPWPRFPQGNASAVSAGHFLSPEYRLVTLKTSLLICSQGLVRGTLCVREAPTRSRTSQKMKATSSLSAEILLCNFLSCFALKSQLLQGFQKRIASAGHLLSLKSPSFCDGRCCHVLSCGHRFERFYCFGESSCALLAVLRTRLQSVFVTC